jgi:hypothetical protein
MVQKIIVGSDYIRKLRMGHSGAHMVNMWASHHTASYSVLGNSMFNLWQVWCSSRFLSVPPANFPHDYNIAPHSPHLPELYDMTALTMLRINTSLVLKL